MKNITHQTPYDSLHGRVKFVTEYVHLRDIKNKKILDIGCGYGWFEVFAKNNQAFSIVGTELTDNDLSTAKKYIREKNITFLKGSAIDLPFKDNTFDTVVSWEVIEHIPKGTEEHMFLEIARVLKKDGICYLSTPHRSFFGTLFDPAFWLIGHRHYSKAHIRKLAMTRFKIHDMRVMGGWWEIISLLDLYISKWIFQRVPFFEKVITRKLDREYEKSSGFTNIFLRMQKI